MNNRRKNDLLVKVAIAFKKFNDGFLKMSPYIIIAGMVFIGVRLVNKIDKTTQSTNEKVEMALPVNYPVKFDTPQNVLREPPLFHLDERVDVEARFLNETDQPITLQADVHYILITDYEEQVEPIETGLYITLKPGCTLIPFSNKRPDAVEILTRKLFAQGHKKVTWKLSGHNQIVAPQQGGRQQFETDEFSFIPDDQPLPKNQLEHIDDSCDNLVKVK